MEQSRYVDFDKRARSGPSAEARGDAVKILVSCLLLLVPLVAHGQLMKCIGPGGRVEYATYCPPDYKEVPTHIRNRPAGSKSPAPSQAPASAVQKSTAEIEADFRKRQSDKAAEEEKARKKSAESAEQREACERARVYVKSIQDGQRISQVDPRTGERVFLEDKDRPAELARAQQIADSNCK